MKCLVFLICVHFCFAEAGAKTTTQPVNPEPSGTSLACNLNRSYSALLFFPKGSSDLILKRLDDRSKKSEEAASLVSVSHVRYGKVEHILSDLGRSGYFYARLEQTEKGLEGHLDINLFSKNELVQSLNTGTLIKTFCRRMQ